MHQRNTTAVPILTIDSASLISSGSTCAEYAEPDDCFKIFMYNQEKEGVHISEKYPGVRTTPSQGYANAFMPWSNYGALSKEQRMQRLMRLNNFTFLGECRGFVRNDHGGWGSTGSKYRDRNYERMRLGAHLAAEDYWGMFLNAGDLESARDTKPTTQGKRSPVHALTTSPNV